MQQPFDYKQFMVLVVDDEPNTPRYFKRAYGDEFRILTATSAEEGLNLLKQHQDEVGVLITDQRMPGHKGTWLLEQARDIKPHLVRMLWSAYCGQYDVLAACKIGIHKFIMLPFDPSEMEIALRGALEQFALVDEFVPRRMTETPVKLGGFDKVQERKTSMNPVDWGSQSASPPAACSQRREAETIVEAPFDYRQFIVLVVDDEKAMLRAFNRAVAAKFRILTATSAEEGLNILKQHKDEVGVLIADSVMPGHKGTWLLEQARDIKPHLVRIYWSCCACHGDSLLEACRIGFHKFIMLPFDPSEMEKTLRGALEQFALVHALVPK